MKKIILFTLCLSVINMLSQNPTYQQKLYYTCKVWGFVKYFHSSVSTCQVNWDSALVSRLPFIKNAVSNNDFNDQIDTLLQIAGPMTIATNPLPDTIQPELKRNRNFNWINQPIFRNDIKIKLDTIRNNFRPHPSCWVQDNTWTTSNYSWLIFPHDNPMYNANTFTNYPNEFTRLLIGFKYWNIINYFNPYNYVIDKPCDSILDSKVLLLANASTPTDFYLAIKKIAHGLNDAHAQATSNTNTSIPFYNYTPPLKIIHSQNKYIVAKSNVTAIKRGDEIVAINGLTTQIMEDSLRPYISAGNNAMFYQFMSMYILNGLSNTSVGISYLDSVGNSQFLYVNRSMYYAHNYLKKYHPNDTLGVSTTWKKFGCNVGYVNMGILRSIDVSSMYANLKNTSSIIFDLRKYPNGTAWDIADLMYPAPMCYAKNMLPDVTYPGTFYWHYDSTGVIGNPTPYSGKVILLINEETQSQGEYTSMIFGALPNSVKVGSQTAGADGNVINFNISTDINTYFSTLGIFYPNEDSTQRIGIVPDYIVHPTAQGIRHHRDEVLEKALEIANCFITTVKKEISKDSSIAIFPNPNNGSFNLELNVTSEITIINSLGQIITTETIKAGKNLFNMQNQPSGIYFIKVTHGEKQYVTKLIKE